MTHPHATDRDPGMLPSQGRCSAIILDPRLKVKARRHERRRIREEIRNWLGDVPVDADS